MRRISKNKSRSDFPAFSNQDVVSAAGRARIHYFDADTGLRQRLQEPGMQEAQAFSSAQQHDFHAQSGQKLEIFLLQCIYSADRPGLYRPIRQDHKTVLMAHRVDHHVAFTVTGKGILVFASGEVKFQGAGFLCCNGADPVRLYLLNCAIFHHSNSRLRPDAKDGPISCP